QVFTQRKRSYRSSRGERSFAGDFREPVPRTSIEAIVAAENAIADQGSQIQRDRVFQFDREIGNAEPCVQFVWRRDRAGRASVNATFAGSTAITRRLIWLQLKGRQKFGEKKPGPKFFFDQHCALAMPADSRRRGVIALQNRSGIDVTFLFATVIT